MSKRVAEKRRERAATVLAFVTWALIAFVLVVMVGLVVVAWMYG